MATKKKAKAGSTVPDNMSLWNSVCVTDPQHTKRVNQRGGFTAIGAQSQIMEATKVFGPFGKGFGVSDEKFTPFPFSEGLGLYQARLWYVLNGETNVIHQFPIHSSIKYSVNGRVDDDFAKKVATDALTKGLSKLGFNADVFLGLFDDNKYVNQLKATATANKVTETYANKTPINKIASTNNGTITDAQIKEVKAALGLVKDKAYAKKVSDALDSGAITPKNYHSSIDKINQKVSNDKADVLINAIEEGDAKAGKK